MPELTPDFEKIARASLHLTSGAFGVAGSHITVDDLAEQLRLVWNARGAADFAAVDDIAHTNYEAIADALRSLDR